MIEFIEAIRNTTGGAPSLSEITPGKLLRFATSDRRGDDNGWCKLFDDGEGGVFGCWRQGISEVWQARQPRTPGEQAAFLVRVKRAQEEAKRLEEERRAECRKRSAELWGEGRDANTNHPYLKTKGIKPYGVRQYKESLLVPVRDSSGTLHGLQFIGPDGSKKFKSGTAVAGCYHAIGRPNGKILVVEGLATGATLHEITGHAVACAFNAGNLKPVAEALRAKLPEIEIIICADDDHATEGNPGLTKATEAARAVNGLLALPSFPDTRGPKDTDYNDMARLSTPEAVRACIHSAKPTEQEPEIWPEPLLFGEIETPPISADLLPSWLGQYCKAVADTTQTPQGMAVMFALSTAATCLQKRFEVCPKGDDYTEPVNIWTVTALDPGNRKTAVRNAFTAPLTLWEQEQAELIAPKIKEIKHRRDINQKAIDQIKTRAAKPETPSIERELALREIIELENETPKEIHPPRLWTDDVTPERLQSLLADHDERMALLSDEGGIFEVMAGLYSNGKANLNVFLQGHAGASVRVDRQGRGVILNKPALSFGLTVQPDVISDLGNGSKTKFRGNGTLARFLYCLPQSTIGNRNMASRATIPETVKTAYHAGIMGLLAIEPVKDEQGNERARLLTLAPDALQAWIQFSQYIESRQGPQGEFYSFQDWTSKLPGAALRIAGLFHVVEHGATVSVINRQTTEKALDLAESLITHARAAFDLMGDDQSCHDAKAVLQWIQKQGEPTFTQKEAMDKNRRFRTVDRLEKALKVLTARHIIGEPKSKVTGGRPSKVYPVNPEILKPV